MDTPRLLCVFTALLRTLSDLCIPVVIVSVKGKQSFKKPGAAVTLTFQLKFSSCVGVMLAQLFQENKQLGRYSGAAGKRERLPYAVWWRAT